MSPNISDIVAAAWDQMMRESPDPFRNHWFDEQFAGAPRTTYRERLDRLPVNVYGDLIPRIVTVRRNLRALSKPRRPPRLP